MTKRSDVSKSPVTQKATARNSAITRRGEEKSLVPGKEQNEALVIASKAVEDKASEEPMREILSPKRPSIKREMIMALEAPQLRAAPSLAKDAPFPQSLQAIAETLATDACILPAESNLLAPDKEVASDDLPESETNRESSFVKKFAKSAEDSVETSTKCLETKTPMSSKGAQKLLSSAEPSFEGKFEKNFKVSHSDPIERTADAGSLPIIPLFDTSEAGKPGKAEAGQEESLEVCMLNELKIGNASSLKKLDISESGKSVKNEVGDAGQCQALSEKGTDIKHAELSQAPQDGDQINDLQLISNRGTDEGETIGQEEETVAKRLQFVVDTSPFAAGGEKVMPPKESVFSGMHHDKNELKYSQPTAAVDSVVSQADRCEAAIVGSNERAFILSSIQQAQRGQEPLATECNLERIPAPQTVTLTEFIDDRASDMLPLGRAEESSFNSSVAKSDRATENKVSSHKDVSSFVQIDSTFTKNMVSSVEGETVLIVENLGALLQAPTKLEGTFSGVSRVVDGQQVKEVEMKVNTENTLEAGKDLIGRKVKKRFGKKFFDGQVVQYEPELNWYKVVYEDGDEEELDLKEVQKLVAEVDVEQLPYYEPHGQPSGSINNLNRNVGQTIQPQSSAAHDDTMEKSNQLQEKIQLRSLKRQHVIDTSNDAKTFSTDSGELSVTSDEPSEEDDDDEDVKIGGRRHSRQKPKAKLRGKKRKKSENTPDGEKAFITKIGLRVRDEKSQDTSTEHRIATRRSTGALTPSVNSSFNHSLLSNKKAHTDSQDKLRSEAQSPSGGGAKLVGRKTRKDFGGQFYHGEIVHYDNRVKYYKVRYEDGDEEELEWGELAPTLLPQEKDRYLPTAEASQETVGKTPQARSKDNSNKKISTVKGKEGAIIPHDGVVNNGENANSTRKWRKKVRTASVSVMMKGTDNWNAASTSTAVPSEPPRPLAAVRFASARDADVFEYFGWGEAVSFDRSKCPELRATHLLPTSSPMVHLAASRHHLAALTAAGQVWVWRCKHGDIHTRCNEWEHVAALDHQNVILVDISGPDVDRASAGYEPEQEDQVPDPFYLAAVCSNGEDIILQGSQPHESVCTYQFNSESQHPGLREAVLHSSPDWLENMGRIVQLSVGMVEAADESPFIGYITDTDSVFIRSATRDFMEEVNLVTGFTGKPLKIQCGRVYHAIILTDDGRAWTWGQGYYPGSNVHSAVFASKWSSPFSICQPAVGTLVGRKVIDVGCYGEDFIALTNDGDVHQWTHALPDPAAGVYNVPATPVYGQRPSICGGDKLKQVTIGAGICAGISESGKVHTWRTPLKGGHVNAAGLLEREATTPLGREEGADTVILVLGTRAATKVFCVAGSLLVVVKRKYRGRRGGKRKLDASVTKGKSPQDEGTGEGED